MNPMVTRCPKCSTSFRITSTQLETANGKVRCGSCLHVFKALDHLVTSSTPETNKASPVKTPQAPSSPAAASKPVAKQFSEPKTQTYSQSTSAASKITSVASKTTSIEKPVEKNKSNYQEPTQTVSRTASTNNAANLAASSKVAPLIPKNSSAPSARTAATAAPTSIRKPNSTASVSQINSTHPTPKTSSSFIDSVANNLGTNKNNVKDNNHPKPKKVLIDKAKALEDEDDLLISDDMDKKQDKGSAYEFDGFIDLDLNPKQSVSLFEREIRYQAPADEKEAADESWAESLLEEEEALDRTPANLREKISSSTTNPIVTSAMIARKQQEIAAKPEPEQSPASVHSDYLSNAEEIDENAYPPLFSLMNQQPTQKKSEDDEFSAAFKKATATPSNSATSAESAPDFANLFGDEEESIELESSVPSNKRSGKSTYKIRMADTPRTTLLMNIMPAPVELTARRVRNWYQQKLWPSLAVLLSIIFLFQIAYFKFDYFSRVEPYRSVYQMLCPVFGCKLPTLVDTKQIQTYHLVVRQHPDIQNALMVDATILNNADFEQPFPDIILSFTTINNTPIASRRFAPKDYLGGELAGKKIMESKVQVHLSLELTDPGPEAVNYTINIPQN